MSDLCVGCSTLERVIEQLVAQIEARFADAQKEMSDPEIFGDRQRAAAAGRNYRLFVEARELGLAPPQQNRIGQQSA